MKGDEIGDNTGQASDAPSEYVTQTLPRLLKALYRAVSVICAISWRAWRNLEITSLVQTALIVFNGEGGITPAATRLCEPDPPKPRIRRKIRQPKLGPGFGSVTVIGGSSIVPH